MGRILSPEFLDRYTGKQPKWGYSGLGYIVYKRTYARSLTENIKEEWYQTVARCIEGAQEIGAGYTKEEAERLFDHIFNLRCNFAGRMLWQLGTGNHKRYLANAFLNCFQGNTKVLTRSGWKQIKDLAGSTQTILTSRGVWTDAPFKYYGTDKLTEVEFTNKKGLTWKVNCTPTHRWLLITHKEGGYKEVTTEGLRIGNSVPIVQSKTMCEYLSPQGIQHGLVYGDGSCNGHESFVDLIDNTYDYCRKYFTLNRIVWSSPKNDRHVRFGGMPNGFKELPNILENKTYLMGFLSGWIAADGCAHKTSGSIRLFSAKKSDMLFAKDVASVCGFRTTEPYLESDTNPFNNELRELWSICFNKYDHPEKLIIREDHLEKVKVIDDKIYQNIAWVKSIKKTNREEGVFCCEVPETHSFVIDGNILTGNCWFRVMKSREAFCFLLENAMLGGGVGFSVSRSEIGELPKVIEGVRVTQNTTKDATFIVPDSREGWVNLIRKVLRAYFYDGKSFSYSTILIRSYGEKINGFGGTASGPQILVDGVTNICKVIESRYGKKLRSIDVVDVCNILGSIVVAGNVRRSSEIALGDPDDYLFIRAKRWDLGDVPNWRAMSNNTIYADDYTHISKDIWDGYEGNGEPYGLFNVKLSRKMGRLGEPKKDNVEGTNPCGEVSLADAECCNLSELYLNNITSKEQLIDCSKLLYKTQKAICAMQFLHEETTRIVHKNMRIGQGITGICQSLDKLEWLDDTYKALKLFDIEWSKKMGWNESIKLTTTKPSGTLSLLSGSTPGVHPAYSKYYIRRVRMASDDKLVEVCKGLGYQVEFSIGFDGDVDHKTSIVSFPCFAGDNAIVAKDMSAIKQLELVKKIQTIWSDNAVSVTVYYRKEELPDIKKWLKENYKDSVKSVSFLLHNEHGFKQAPYEEITEEHYKDLVKGIKPLTSVHDGKELELQECSSGACPIK